MATIQVELDIDESWTAPNGVLFCTMEVWGQGGNGVSGAGPGGTSGSGGGGGAYSKQTTVEVTPGHSYTRKHITGLGVSVSNQTCIVDEDDTQLVMAEDGIDADVSTGLAHNGGQAANGIGDLKYSGGSGAPMGHPYIAGGGGGGATSIMDGEDADGSRGGGGRGESFGGDGNLGGDGINGAESSGGGGGSVDPYEGGTGGHGRARITYDSPSPTISSVTGPANGSYKAGTILDFIVSWSDTVNVTGTPFIALVIGTSNTFAAYLSAVGPSTSTFRHTVTNGENDTDGITSSSPIQLNGGTILSVDGTSATLSFTPPDTDSVLVDTTPPTVTSANINSTGTILTVNFSESVTGGTGFTMPGWTLGAASGTGNSRTFTITPAVVPIDAPKLSYAPGNVQDIATNPMSNFTNTSITNNSQVQTSHTGSVSTSSTDATVVFLQPPSSLIGLTVTGSGSFRYAINDEVVNATTNSCAIANGDMLFLKNPTGIYKIQLYANAGESDQNHTVAALLRFS